MTREKTRTPKPVLYLAEIPKDMTPEERHQIAERIAAAMLGERDEKQNVNSERPDQ